MKYSYYPGCSLEKNAAAYDISTKAIAQPLGLELVEVEDWNCCGATEYLSLNLSAANALIARNLALASQAKGVDQVIAPCSLCYLNLKKTDKYMKEDPALAKKVNSALAAGNLSYQPGTLKARHLLDVIVNDIGLEAVKEKVIHPLKGLRIAPYYGCMIVRPNLELQGKSFDNPEYPTTLDNLLKTLGAEVIDFPMKAHCCGGHMTQISESTAFELIHRLIRGADIYHADMIVTLCPMCQLNLDAYQGAMNTHMKTRYHIPVMYFTQMIGLAFGMEAAQLGFGQELVDARPALAKIGIEAPAPLEQPTKKPKKDDKSLPMPRMN